MNVFLRTTPFRPYIFCLLLIFFSSAAAALGQSAAGSIANRPTGPFTEALERRNRETALRSLKVDPAERRPAAVADPAVVERLNEDFKRIQVVRLGLVRDIKQGSAFEYGRLEKDAAEIKKLAGRLRTFFDGPEMEEIGRVPAKVEFDKQQIPEAVHKLCLEISRFLENRMFKSQAAYNARDAAEAARTLETVMELSANIKRSAEKLKRSN